MQPLANRNKIVWLHVSFWCVYLSFFLYQMASFRRKEFEFNQALLHASVQVAFTMLVAYMNYFLLLPRFLERKNITRYLLEFALPFALLIFLRVHLQRFMVDGYTHQERYFYSTVYIVQLVAVTLFIVIFIAMLHFVKDWFALEARRREIENEKLTAELNFLKAQINPHFLFNTLNNLYYLAYSNSSNTTEVIARLSQMMRYMIYDSNHPKVLLSKEIEYMENYISLERLRLNNEVPIDFKVEGDTHTVWIAPLILITFLENAFKHGVTSNSTMVWITVSIRLTGKECTYTVKNSKVTRSSPEGTGKSGIGLQNVKRRLELSYPNQFDLKVDDLADQYSVQLKLTLS